MRLFILSILLLIIAGKIPLQAQDFSRSIGVRYGYSDAIIYDRLVDDITSHRFMLQLNKNRMQLTAMKYYQFYHLDELPKNYSFYYGYGVHAGYITWNQYYPDTDIGTYWAQRTAGVMGLDGVIGISYQLDKIPISIACEAHPFFDLWGKNFFEIHPFDFALTALYHF